MIDKDSQMALTPNPSHPASTLGEGCQSTRATGGQIRDDVPWLWGNYSAANDAELFIPAAHIGPCTFWGNRERDPDVGVRIVIREIVDVAAFFEELNKVLTDKAGIVPTNGKRRVIDE